MPKPKEVDSKKKALPRADSTELHKESVSEK